jgi:hypothetical protein
MIKSMSKETIELWFVDVVVDLWKL